MNIISLILEAAKRENNDSNSISRRGGRSSSSSGATLTKIMYRAFLSHTQLKSYLTYLVDNGLLQYYSFNQTFQTTEKGLVFLRTYSEMDEMIKMPPELQGNNDSKGVGLLTR
jgi:predicted transcriptional regulator